MLTEITDLDFRIYVYSVLRVLTPSYLPVHVERIQEDLQRDVYLVNGVLPITGQMLARWR